MCPETPWRGAVLVSSAQEESAGPTGDGPMVKPLGTVIHLEVSPALQRKTMPRRVTPVKTFGSE